MRRLITFPLAVLLGSITLTAQAPSPTPPRSFGVMGTVGADQPFVYVYPSSSPECPVSMRAEQQGGGVSVLVTRDGQRHPAPKRIRLILTRPLSTRPLSAPQIVSAKVTVRGANGKAGMVPAATLGATLQLARKNSGQDGSAESTKTLDLTFAKAENGSAAADMDLPGFTAVASIRIDSLSYSDGSTWTAFHRNICHTAPDPFMLVTAR
jgi:hypothetical protein